MPTFQQLQDQYKKAKFKRAIVKHLVEYLDENFRSSGAGPSKKKLLDEDNVPVPEDVFEEISVELTAREESLDLELTGILSSSMGSNQP